MFGHVLLVGPIYIYLLGENILKNILHMLLYKYALLKPFMYSAIILYHQFQEQSAINHENHRVPDPCP